MVFIVSLSFGTRIVSDALVVVRACRREVDKLVPSPPLTPAAPAARKQMEALLQQTSGIVSAGGSTAGVAGGRTPQTDMLATL